KTCQKATASLWMCRRLWGPNWGLKPLVAFWAYTTVVRPIITYAALVWWRSTEMHSVRAALERVQRLGCLMVTGVMRTTPIATIEELLGLEPLHLRVEFEARKAALRLQGLENFKRTGERGHTTA